MRNLTYIIIAIVALTLGACTGKQGPMGPQGPEGPAGELNANRGILYESSKVSGENYWDIYCPWIADTSMVDVWVRQNSGYMWQIPRYYFSSEYVRIFDNSTTDPGDEYLIVGIE